MDTVDLQPCRYNVSVWLSISDYLDTDINAPLIHCNIQNSYWIFVAFAELEVEF